MPKREVILARALRRDENLRIISAQRSPIFDLFCVLLSAIPIFWLQRLVNVSPFLESLNWDPASHALDALKLYNSLARFDLISFFAHLNAMVWWPPMGALLSLPFMVIIGNSFLAPTWLSLVCFYASLLVPYFFLSRLSFRRSYRALPAFIIYFLWMIGSTLIVRFSIFVMLELPGAIFTLLSVIGFWRAYNARNDGEYAASQQYYRLASLALVFLLLIKWNYGLQVAVAVLLYEVWLMTSVQRKEILRHLFMPTLSFKRYPILTTSGYFALAVAILIKVTGGGRYELFEHTISITRMGNPLWMFLFLGTIKMVRLFRNSTRAQGAVLSYHKTLFRWFVVPYLIWFLFPVPNRVQYLLFRIADGSPANDLNYFMVLSRHFLLSNAHQVFMWIGIAIAFCSAWRKRESGARFGLLYIAFCFFSCIFLTYQKEPRVLITILPVVYLVSAWGYGCWMEFHPSGYFALVVAFIFTGLHWNRIENHFTHISQPESLAFYDERLLRDLRRYVVERIDGSTRITTLGLEDMPGLCPLMEWELHRKFPRFSKWPQPRVCDHGHQTSADEHILGALKQRALDWLIVFTGSPSESVQKTREKIIRVIENKNDFIEKHHFTLEGSPYSGIIYRFPNLGLGQK